MTPTGKALRAGHGAVKVLGVEVKLDGDDGRELFVRGEIPEPRALPVYEITLRVAPTAPVESAEPATGAAEEAAWMLLGAKGPPRRNGWLARWLASEREKMRGTTWRVEG